MDLSIFLGMDSENLSYEGIELTTEDDNLYETGSIGPASYTDSVPKLKSYRGKIWVSCFYKVLWLKHASKDAKRFSFSGFDMHKNSAEDHSNGIIRQSADSLRKFSDGSGRNNICPLRYTCLW